jgi:hypothetical protein
LASPGGDEAAQSGIGGEDAVVALAVDAGRRDEAGEGVEKFEGREREDGAPIGGGPGQAVDHTANVTVTVGGVAVVGRRGGGLDGEAFEGEGRAGAVAQQSLAAGAVAALDA